MKNERNSDTYEPTLADVLGAVQSGFAKVDERLTNHDTLFARHEGMLTTLREGQENLKEQMNDNTRRLINTQNRVEDIADILEVDHERRITRLEKTQAV